MFNELSFKNKLKYTTGYIVGRTINVIITSITLMLSYIDKEYVYIRRDPVEASRRLKQCIETCNNKYTIAACEVLLYGKNPAFEKPLRFNSKEIKRISLYELSKLYIKLKLVAL